MLLCFGIPLRHRPGGGCGQDRIGAHLHRRVHAHHPGGTILGPGHLDDIVPEHRKAGVQTSADQGRLTGVARSGDDEGAAPAGYPAGVQHDVAVSHRQPVQQRSAELRPIPRRKRESRVIQGRSGDGVEGEDATRIGAVQHHPVGGDTLPDRPVGREGHLGKVQRLGCGAIDEIEVDGFGRRRHLDQIALRHDRGIAGAPVDEQMAGAETKSSGDGGPRSGVVPDTP